MDPCYFDLDLSKVLPRYVLIPSILFCIVLSCVWFESNHTEVCIGSPLPGGNNGLTSSTASGYKSLIVVWLALVISSADAGSLIGLAQTVNLLSGCICRYFNTSMAKSRCATCLTGWWGLVSCSSTYAMHSPKR
jgi:hypothetical protein